MTDNSMFDILSKFDAASKPMNECGMSEGGMESGVTLKASSAAEMAEILRALAGVENSMPAAPKEPADAEMPMTMAMSMELPAPEEAEMEEYDNEPEEEYMGVDDGYFRCHSRLAPSGSNAGQTRYRAEAHSKTRRRFGAMCRALFARQARTAPGAPVASRNSRSGAGKEGRTPKARRGRPPRSPFRREDREQALPRYPRRSKWPRPRKARTLR